MRRALIVGIDDYPKCPLSGCVNDAQKMNIVLSRHHDNRMNFDCQLLTSPSTIVSRALLRRKLFELFKQPADVAFFHFSGHGTLNGIGGYLVTRDYDDYDVGIPMAEVLSLANQSPVHDIFITLDCCHSGSFGILPVISNERIVISEGVSVITATRSDQAAIEVGGGGIFTSLLVEALDGGASSLLGEVTAASVYSYIDNSLGAWEQRPMFKANVSKFIRLREAPPKIPPILVRKLIEYFPLPSEPLPLSPEFEPENEPHDDSKVEIFRHLQEFRNFGLVKPIGAEHMYYAAMNSQTCGLTTLGKYYWRLVKDDKI